MDALMNYINKHSTEYGVRLQYATLKDYFQAVHQSNLSWEVRGNQDFLPYSTGKFSQKCLASPNPSVLFGYMADPVR